MENGEEKQQDENNIVRQVLGTSATVKVYQNNVCINKYRGTKKLCVCFE